MDNRKISDLTVDEFKIMMEEMFNAHDAVYQANKRAFDYANRNFRGGLEGQLSINHQLQQQAANYKSGNPVSPDPAKPRK